MANTISFPEPRLSSKNTFVEVDDIEVLEAPAEEGTKLRHQEERKLHHGKRSEKKKKKKKKKKSSSKVAVETHVEELIWVTRLHVDIMDYEGLSYHQVYKRQDYNIAENERLKTFSGQGTLSFHEGMFTMVQNVKNEHDFYQKPQYFGGKNGMATIYLPLTQPSPPGSYQQRKASPILSPSNDGP
ncbi:hypothetical protein NE237_003913 [Protea cynaroides]|uniref:Uncharacterized protein n=1 Tax=Protea cynaroides TaxID=273540 RepID=A0A9Q0QT62_9MAGN|nr:hypothetical protein NE237_003913 [Protea cynaroides]